MKKQFKKYIHLHNSDQNILNKRDGSETRFTGNGIRRPGGNENVKEVTKFWAGIL